MSTIHALRAELDSAQRAYLNADIEHPTAVHLAKESLTNARFDYWAACADLVTRLPGVIRESSLPGMLAVYEEITGEKL